MQIIPLDRMGIVRSLIEICMIGLVGISIFKFYPNETRTVLFQAYERYKPCGTPVTYRIGMIDPRFGLSTDTVESMTQQAAQKWNYALGRTVVQEDPQQGIVVVNFAFDKRQDTENALDHESDTVSANKAAYLSLQEQYNALYQDYTARKTHYDQLMRSYNDAKAQYTQLIQRSQGHAVSPTTLKQINALAESLNTQQTTLNTESQAINSDSTQINALVASMHQHVDTANAAVDNFNSLNATVGDTYEEGLFVSTFGHESITIYEFDSNTQLSRVLTHEIGHAIGLEHVADSDAIMNPVNKSKNTSLTVADVTELDRVCGI